MLFIGWKMEVFLKPLTDTQKEYKKYFIFIHENRFQEFSTMEIMLIVLNTFFTINDIEKNILMSSIKLLMIASDCQ